MKWSQELQWIDQGMPYQINCGSNGHQSNPNALTFAWHTKTDHFGKHAEQNRVTQLIYDVPKTCGSANAARILMKI